MKTFFDSLKISFVLLGAILGAGFVSGSELINFFGLNGFAPFFLFSGILFFLVLVFLFALFKSKIYNKNINVVEGKFFVFGTIVSSLIVCVCSLSGISELLNTELFEFSFPFYAIIFLLISFLVLEKDIRGVEYVNMIIVPLLIGLTVCLIFRNAELKYVPDKKPFLSSTIKAILYVFLNIFSNVKVMRISARNKSLKSCVISAIIVSMVIVFLGLIILFAICNRGKNINKEIPLLFLSNKKINKIFYGLSLLFAMFSSLIADLCSVKEMFIKENDKYIRYKELFLFLLILFLSLIKISNIVKYLYPIIGGIGFIYFFGCIKILYRGKIYKKEQEYAEKKE